MKKIIISALIICSSFSYAQAPISSEIKQDLSSQYISWKRPPKISFTNTDLKGEDRTLIFKLFVSPDGTIAKTEIIKSSGVEELDLKLQHNMKSATFKPLIENGIAIPFVAEQPFNLELAKTERPWWKKILFIP